MKSYFILLALIFTLALHGQTKHSYVHFNHLTEVKGTEFVIASMANRSKIAAEENRFLLFIDTKTGNTSQVDFPKGGFIGKINQVKIDNLQINKIIVSAATVDLDERKGIDWNDPDQIFVFSPDGKEKTQLTADNFFTRTWTVNRQTGSIVITGHYDTNANGKLDSKDQNEILIFDLKTMELKSKI